MKTKNIIIIGVVTIVVLGVVIYVLVRKGKLKNKNPNKILIVGDSQSAIKTADGKDISFTWPRLVKNYLEPKGYSIDVLALGGMPTKWMRDNLPAQLSGKKYDRVYILGGGNDSANSSIALKSTLDNFQSMVDMANANGADPFIMLGYRIDNFSDYRKMPLTPYIKRQEDWIPYIERRKQIQDNLKSIKNTGIVPIYDLNGMTNDGIHPTAQGHKIIAQKMISHITQ
jgi:lysophospholipase L1-like esterase